MPSKSRKKVNVIAIIGPTASGKTGLAVALANAMNSCVISADSRQVYRRMDIGTGKDLHEFNQFDPPVPYHMIDILEAGEEYNVFDYQQTCNKLIHQLNDSGELPVLCGGTGMYLDAVLFNYDLKPAPKDAQLRTSLSDKSLEEIGEQLGREKKLHNKTDSLDKERAIRALEIERSTEQSKLKPVQSLVIGLRGDREVLKERINSRLKHRLENGMIEEVQGLVNHGISLDKLKYYGLEYAFVGSYLNDEFNYNDLYQKLRSAIHQFSKRQMTWFRRMEKKGLHIHWLNFEQSLEEQLSESLQIIQNEG